MTIKVIYDAQKTSGEWMSAEFYVEDIREACKRIKNIASVTMKGQADIYYNACGYMWIHKGQKIW